MTHTTQVLSDERVAEVLTTSYGSPEWTMDDARAARAIESATLKAVSGQEPHAKPYGHHYRINNTFDAFELGSEPPPDDAYDAGTLVPLYTLPLAQPAPVDEREIINGLNAMRNLFKWWLDWDKTPNELGTSLVSIPEKPSRNVTQAWVDLLAKAETHIAALQCAQAPQPTKGGEA